MFQPITLIPKVSPADAARTAERAFNKVQPDRLDRSGDVRQPG